jgi:16S rRNA (uracil1498-N3)-methyltransferase
MQLFYAHSVVSKQAFLDTEETRHCTKTLRKKVGDIIALVDGQGGMYRAQIDIFDKKSCQLTIVETLVDAQKRDFKIHIAIAPTKNINRLEWFLEKTTEIGIDSITPILCQRSERKNIRLDRLQKIIVSAAKQSLKSQFPTLNELTKFKTFVQQTHPYQKLIAHCNTADLIPLKNSIQPQQDVLILIGPEGDFSEEEVALASEHGFGAISLGKSRLRTETAGIAACHTIHLIQ